MDTGVTETFFLLPLLAGRTRALLLSTPFSLLPSEENKSPDSYEPKLNRLLLIHENTATVCGFKPSISTTTSIFSLSAGSLGSLCCLPFQLCFLLSFPILNRSLKMV